MAEGDEQSASEMASELADRFASAMRNELTRLPADRIAANPRAWRQSARLEPAAGGTSPWRARLRVGLRQPLRFATVGVLNTAIALLVIYLAAFGLGLGPVLANALGYGIGLLTSFALNRRWTFAAAAGNRWAQATRFTLAVLLAYALNLGTVLLMLALGLPEMLAQAAGIPPYTAALYLLSHSFVFKARRTPASPGPVPRAAGPRGRAFRRP